MFDENTTIDRFITESFNCGCEVLHNRCGK